MTVFVNQTINLWKGRQEENEFEKQTEISWFIMHSWFNKKRQKVIRLHLSRCIANFFKPEVLLNYEEYKDFT
ncbi:Protein CBG17136 [Caenorhabditis briggsae]|uniref:Protein CBG17136 n=1 Tax=Caenorhabditis briggsae TaxID=6238 RepID=A8XQP6_CAEBR|nr:Protein CBG17136 [Caenorhabditis briggsae]CAP34971.2 Protein CBG17136 [Caenorhabditis briggsae]